MSDSYPLFLVPLEFACSSHLTAEEKLVLGSLETWLHTRRPADWGEIAGRISLSVHYLHDVMIELSNKELLEYDLTTGTYDIKTTRWIRAEARRFACETVSVSGGGE